VFNVQCSTCSFLHLPLPLPLPPPPHSVLSPPSPMHFWEKVCFVYSFHFLVGLSPLPPLQGTVDIARRRYLIPHTQHPCPRLPIVLALALAFLSPLPSHCPRPHHHPCQCDADADAIVISPPAFIHTCAHTHAAGSLGMSLLLTNSTFTDVFRHCTGPRLTPSALTHARTRLWTLPLTPCLTCTSRHSRAC
jgi:hypothetical protein